MPWAGRACGAPYPLAAAADAGRSPVRIVAGLPVAVHDDAEEARAAAEAQFGFYGALPTTSASSPSAA